MKKYLLFLITTTLLLSCGNRKDTVPQSSYVLNKKEMAIVLVDVYLAEASLMTTMQDGRNTKEFTSQYYNYIFKKHNITRVQFVNSMHYYSYHLKEMKDVYIDVINRLTVLQNRPKPK